jgi:IstB-like ATP binding protein
VVDEVGYLTYGTDAANMLFHVVNDRHRRNKSMIFTTNKGLKAWGRVLHDDDLAQAIIDRVLERGRLIRLDGPSVRTLHLNLDEAMKEGSDQDAEVARISGNRWPDFPEPTQTRPNTTENRLVPRTRRQDQPSGKGTLRNLQNLHPRFKSGRRLHFPVRIQRFRDRRAARSDVDLFSNVLGFGDRSERRSPKYQS